MVSCAVARCKNSSTKATKSKDGITFHRFPQDEQRRKRWEIAVSREPGWTPTDSSAVCSEHFELKDFYFTESGLRRLSTEAAPTINISSCEVQQTISDESQPDINSMDTDEVMQLKYKVHRLEVIARNRKRRINLMWQEKKRMQSKMNQMQAVIEHLIEKHDKEKT